ncbi:hypothetical protein JXA59_00785 [Patescibacteria group bacterium]|nr:hypothetical protein [Patescibacteria group bacterium]
MSKASQSIIIIASLILLVGAGGCGLRLVTQPGDGSVVPDATSTDSSDTVNQQIGGRGIAERWITDNAPTYKFDGENLQFMQSVSANKCVGAMLYEFTFDSRNGGYGNRVNEALDGVKTAHTIQITVQTDTVAAAVTDNRYNEMSGQFGELTEATDTQTKCL